MAENNAGMVPEDKDPSFSVRKARIRRRLRYINVSTILCLIGMPIWIAVRLFFCWSDACHSIWCWFCGLSWIINLLLLIVFASLFGMSLELFRISRSRKEPLPPTIERPWVPGTKFTKKSIKALNRRARSLAHYIPGAEKIAHKTKGLASSVSAIPGMPSLQEGVKRSYQHIHTTIGHMERGRSMVQEAAPERWTFFFTLVALLLALYLMFWSPFKNMFWI